MTGEPVQLSWAVHTSEPLITLGDEPPPGQRHRIWPPVSSTLISGRHDAVLVDTPITVGQATSLGDWIAATGKRLTTIYITHGHGDHWFGLTGLCSRFPAARAVAIPAVVDQMRRHTGQAEVGLWHQRFPGQVPDRLVLADELNDHVIELDGHELVPVGLGHTDTDDTTCLHIPSVGLVAAGDSVYNGVYLQLRESTPRTRQEWIAALDTVEALGPTTVIAGHKQPGQGDGPENIAATRDYIQAFERALADGRTGTRALRSHDRTLSAAGIPRCAVGVRLRTGRAAGTQQGRSVTLTSPAQTLIQPRFRNVDGLSVRFAESPPRDNHALLLNPWPESLFAFAPTWARLAEHAHLVAVDLPGFGHSERRSELLAPRAMGDFVVRLADAFGLESPHAVGPDVGTGALLFAAALRPGRFRSLVVGSGGSSYPFELGEPLTSWVGAPDLESYRSADPRQIVGAALAAIEAPDVVPGQIREDYLSAYDGDRFVESMRYVRAYPAELPVLAELLPGTQTPVQIIAGVRDTAIPPSNAEFLHARLPHSKLDIIDAGHFTWEDNASAYASLVTQWWEAGYTRA
jgi:pimeloyl-ACP methyl ester carboxylesterase/glyoxylase-like metal-dependent hydrolase (beta-lactamase superfamily II)